tara:strand:- start:302 stop:889 length:588 start_codon:yes stop_codon:yes gene_type:complete
MPRKTIDDYTFYKIVDVNGDLDLCYVGSSVNMKKRKDKHKTACKSPNHPQHHLKVYKTIRENGGWDEFRVVEIGFREQLTLTQAHIVEDEYRVLLKAELNSRRCHRTEEEQNEYFKKYYEDHKEYLNEYNKNYREDHKEDKKEYDKKYKEDNKEVIKAKKSVKHICPCGGKYSHNHKARHEKSQRHQAYTANQGI